MSSYQYVALDADGKQSRGQIDGDSARQARVRLRERKLFTVSILPVQAGETRSGQRFALWRRVSVADLSLFTRQLATLVKAGLPLEEALRAVAEQTERASFRGVILAVRTSLMEGQTLAGGFTEFPRIFPEIYRATVSAGEQTGHLDSVLDRLADYTESREKIRHKVLEALLYPSVLTLMCIAIVSILLTYVVPKVVEVFESSRAKLPLPTRFLVSSSAIARDYGIWILLALAIAAIALWRWLREPAARRRFQLLQLRLPLLGRLVRGFNTTRFTRTLSILTESAVPVLEALRISGQVITNLPMRDAVDVAATKVSEGDTIGHSLAASHLFPPMTIHLISSGESSGTLEDMLERAALNQDRELDRLMAAMVGLLGPLMIVGMGLLVMGIVFAMLLPIFEMNKLIS